MRFKILLFFSVTFLFLGEIIAQKANSKKQNLENRAGFYLQNPKQNYAKIPFEFQSNLIVLKMCLDDSDTLRLIFDTGISTNIITDTSLVRKLNLKFARRVRINGAGEEKGMMGSVSINHSLNYRDLKGSLQNLVVIDDDVLHLSEYMGMKVHGIFGHEIFNNFVVTIDYENKFIYLYPNDKFSPKPSDGSMFSIVVTQTKPYTEALQLMQNGAYLTLRLVIDTGAGHALLLNANDTKIKLPKINVRANLGRGLNGEINGYIGRVDSLKFGETPMKNIIASFPDSLSFSKKFIALSEDRQGSIGSELLRRFQVTFNYAEGYILLKPNIRRLKETFEYDMSGLEIRARGENFTNYFVHKVIPDSPADLIGIREEDEILFLDGNSADNLTISDIYKILSKKEGKTVSFFMKRNGEVKLFEFKLKRII